MNLCFEKKRNFLSHATVNIFRVLLFRNFFYTKATSSCARHPLNVNPLPASSPHSTTNQEASMEILSITEMAWAEYIKARLIQRIATDSEFTYQTKQNYVGKHRKPMYFSIGLYMSKWDFALKTKTQVNIYSVTCFFIGIND